MTTPGNYGWLHLLFLALTAATAVFLILRYRDANGKTVRRILGVAWIVMVVLEIYKQLVFSMGVTEGVAHWDYQWYAFPFQFCSTPLYALPFLVFLKDGKVRDAFMTFFTGFSLFAGIAVMLYPGDVFIDMIGINIQTMVHHGMQVALGLFLVAYNRRRLCKKSFLGSLAVFYGFVLLAMGMNEVLHRYLAGKASEETFNMFYISPHHPCTLPILSDVYAKVPYPVFLVIYLAGFALLSFGIYGAEKGILALVSRKKAHA
ncbi:MAG: YwaF family protein [Clostridia bacterium]|nr:YwaF family protein [Clostridia bacterium]